MKHPRRTIEPVLFLVTILGLLAVITWLGVALLNRTKGQAKPQAPRAAAARPNPQVAQPDANDELVVEAMNSCVQKLKEAANAHAANAKLLQESRIMDMAGVVRPDQLEEKQAVVRSFLASNDEMKRLLANEEKLFQEELEALKVPHERIASELKTYRSGVRDKDAVILRREADQRIAQALSRVLTYLSETWGQWSFNKERQRVQFDMPGALKKYNDFMEEIEAATLK